jgi:hypothetical protein
LQLDTPRTLDHIFPGSWINANFDVWIGAPEDNKAWEYLLRARQKYDELAPNVSDDARTLAYEELLIAEGSDWCWWYGPEHQSENRPEFDELYRKHLSNVYRALQAEPPEELARPILIMQVRDVHEPPSNPIHPVIDGEVTSYFEWMGAGHYQLDNRSGAMHGQRTPVRDLYYGADAQNFYLRLDLEGAADLSRIELRAGDATIPLAGNPQIESAHRKIFEVRAPLSFLGITEDKTLRFQLSIAGESIPPDGWIELNLLPA